MQLTKRCYSAGHAKIFIDYYDKEWAVPEYDSRSLFEKVMLETFHSGLNQTIILKKCGNFRSAFTGFDPRMFVNWGQKDIGFNTFLWRYVNNKPIENT